MKNATILLVLALSTPPLLYTQQTDLSGLKVCIDPGHGGLYNHIVPDAGIDFYESESNLQKAFWLDTLLRERGATVILTRSTTDENPDLTARVAVANANNVNWFHSIHSNATNGVANYTLVLVRESTTEAGQPQSPEALAMAATISPKIYAVLRTPASYTRLDYAFLGFRLGVLNGLLMPGELSEGSFHDVPAEARRLMNKLYKKIEAYALRNSFMSYFSVPPDSLGIIAGIQSDLVTSKGVNFSRVRLLPLDRVVTGDPYNNGFYMFDNLPSGTYTLRFETPGYLADSAQVTLGVGATAFVDRSLVSQADPAVLSASPANNDTTVLVNAPVVLNFSKPMDTASVRTAFSITPALPGKLQWTNSNGTLTFTPTVYFDPWVIYQVRVDTMARSASGQNLDGNGDGTPGDPYVLNFKTKYVDVFPPAIAHAFPGSMVEIPVPTPVVNITFDEPLNQTTVNTSNFLIQLIGGSLQYKNLEYAQENGRGGVTMYMPNGFNAGSSYRVRVSRVADLLGNVIPTASSILWDFPIASGAFSTALIDSVNPGTTGLAAPQDPADRVGVDSLVIGPASGKKVGIVAGNPGALSVRCVWDTSLSTWEVRVPLDSSSAGGRVRFQKTNAVLRAYVHGDGGHSQVRFVVADSVDAFPARVAEHIEVSRWFPIDWVGWRALHWDLEADSIGAGSGNGILEGLMRFDGMQFRYLPGTSKSVAQLYVDQIECVQRTPTGVGSTTRVLPESFALYPAYPNPFNPTTVVSCQLPVASTVRLVAYDLLGREVAVLLEGEKEAGRYEAEWNAAGLSSGIYIVRLMVSSTSGDTQFISSQKIILMK